MEKKISQKKIVEILRVYIALIYQNDYIHRMQNFVTLQIHFTESN